MQNLASEALKPKTNKYHRVSLAILLSAAAGLTVFSLLPWQQLAALFLLLLCSELYRKAPRAQGWAIAGLSWLGTVVTALFIGLYRPEGFDYPVVINEQVLHKDGKVFSLYFNTAQLLAGFILLVQLGPAASYGRIWLRAQSIHMLLLGLGLSAVILFAASYLLKLELHIKHAGLWLSFTIINVLCTCIAEESFIRLVIQRQLGRVSEKLSLWLHLNKSKYLLVELVPLALTTLVFAAVHPIISWQLSAVFLGAGLLYGLLYSLSKNIFTAIAVHGLVNSLHFLLLSYPIV
ncbi:type II CAAX prenyl endopeptidase Rce1 family protein [Agaribacterium haliotis]|uniref:CPBP family glutamic-type intramembrane protease n=1 Tax=Agaribacterium haliotis TaxID=2013869 RepID=UPI000BB536D7|nr:CPBP family glutamic-type intramembrane protease [Agaribacterium haliotis]